MSEIKTVQLTDIHGDKISPYTPASTVYYIYEEGGETKIVNMETKLGTIDIDKISNLQEEAVEDIVELSGTSVQKIIDERDSYQSDINSLSATVKTLYDKTFPLVITTSITGNTSSFACRYYYKVEESSALVSGATIVVTHQRNDASAVQIYNGPLATQTLSGSTTQIGWGRDVFKITATKSDGKTKDATDRRYLCLYGASTEEMTSSDLETKLNRSFAASFTSATVTTTSQNKYIWLAVPSYMTITKVTSQGVDVSLVNRGPYTLGGNQYKAYRSQEELKPTEWSLAISVSITS